MLEVPGAVYTLWIIGLAVAVVLLPVVVSLLHHLWRDASQIERYAAESLAAGAAEVPRKFCGILSTHTSSTD